MRVWYIDLRRSMSTSLARARSRKVIGNSLKKPSATSPSMMRLTSSEMLSSVYSASERDAAYTPSAIIRMACSRVNGLGPGYWNCVTSTLMSGCSFLYLM